MSRRTLCDPPDGWKERIKELEEQEPLVDGTILLGVELALELAWFLGYPSETPLVVPAILSSTPVYGVTYTNEQRLAIANVRRILPYSSSSAWRTDLAVYCRLPDEWRHYDFSRTDIDPSDGAGQPQRRKTKPDLFKIVSGPDSGGGVAYRHPPMIEMVPFFVHPDLESDDGKAALCRIPHYLRFSPAWAMGNLDSPYPLHLGDVLIKDQLCILGLGED